MSRSFSNRDMLSVTGICLLVAGVLLFLRQAIILPIVLVMVAAIFILAIVTSTIILTRSAKLSSQYTICIDHEGVHWPRLFRKTPDTELIRWDEISTFILHTRTFSGHYLNVLGVVLHDPEATLARLYNMKAGHPLSRFVIKTYLNFYKGPSFRTPLNIPQTLVPVPLEELLEMIQERFADELYRHHIILLKK